MGHPAQKKKQELFKKKHPEGRKKFAQAKRKKRLEKRLIKERNKNENKK